MIRETGSFLTVIYLNENIYCNRSLYSTLITGKNFSVAYVVGILNSKAIQYYYQQKFKAETDLFPKIRIKQAKLLPIPTATMEQQNSIAVLVEEIIKLKRQGDYINASKCEKRIDQIVYILYDLNHDEIEIIENNSI